MAFTEHRTPQPDFPQAPASPRDGPRASPSILRKLVMLILLLLLLLRALRRLRRVSEPQVPKALGRRGRLPHRAVAAACGGRAARRGAAGGLSLSAGDPAPPPTRRRPPRIALSRGLGGVAAHPGRGSPGAGGPGRGCTLLRRRAGGAPACGKSAPRLYSCVTSPEPIQTREGLSRICVRGEECGTAGIAGAAPPTGMSSPSKKSRHCLHSNGLRFSRSFPRTTFCG